MGRYQKIDERIWNDEVFNLFNPFEKLLWFTLLTHPLMTPMGAGTIYKGLLNEVIGNTGYGGYCFRCDEIQCNEKTEEDHYAETLLERFREGSLILLDGKLIIVKNKLIYNRPDNPNQLYSWLHSCEELPRSSAFKELYEHLRDVDEDIPEWIFAGLLEPLKNQQNRTLKKEFWNRVEPFIERDKKVKGKVSGKVKRNPPRKVNSNPPKRLKETLPETNNNSSSLLKDKEKKINTNPSSKATPLPTSNNETESNGQPSEGLVQTENLSDKEKLVLQFYEHLSPKHKQEFYENAMELRDPTYPTPKPGSEREKALLVRYYEDHYENKTYGGEV